MYKVSVMYPNQPGAKFDFDYYRSTHMKLVEKHMKPFGLQKTGVERGIDDGAGQPAPYLCIGHLYFDRADGYDQGIKEAAPVLRGDAVNYTNITPIRQKSEVLD
jgi:uncharacterized protein (TIGR02118 family)